MDALQRVIGSHGGRDILFREIKYERYRKPHVVEYPRNAIVLNPRHTQQQRQQHQQNQPGDEEDGNGSNAGESNSGDEDGDDDDAGENDSYGADGIDGERSGVRRRKRRVPPKGRHVDDDDPLYLPEEELLCSDEKLMNQFLALQWRHITGPGCGLENAGNTCFANAVLQALAYTPAIAQFLMSYFKAPDPNPSAPHDFGFALAETIRLIHSSSGGDKRRGGRVVRPGRIVGNLRLLSPHFRLGRQSDAHEFAAQLLHACQRSLIYRQQHVLIPGGVGGATGPCRIQPAVQHTSALMRICGGFLRSQVAWSRKDEIAMLRREGKKQSAVDLEMEEENDDGGVGDRSARDRLVSNTYDPFAILNIEVVGRSIEDCLAHFCAAETLPDRIYRSPRGVGVKATKQFSIHNPPHVLLLHLKRFSSTGAKISKTVAYSPLLDLTPYCNDDFRDSYAFDEMSTTSVPSSASASSSFDSKSPRKMHGKHFDGNANASLSVAGSGRRRILYTLNAIVIHEGSSIQYGHYYSVVRAKNGTWLVCDDSRVETCSEQRALQCQAYMLFYSRVPEPESNKTCQPARPSTSAVAVPKAGGAREWKGVGVGGLLDTLNGHKSFDSSASLSTPGSSRRSLPTTTGKKSNAMGMSSELYGKELSEEEVAAAVAAAAAAASKQSSARKSEGSETESHVGRSGKDDHDGDDDDIDDEGDEGPYPIRASRGSILLPTKLEMESQLTAATTSSSENRVRKSQRMGSAHEPKEAQQQQRPSQRPSHAQSLMKSMYGGIASSLARSQSSGSGAAAVATHDASSEDTKSVARKIEKRHAKEEQLREDEEGKEEESASGSVSVKGSNREEKKVSKVGVEALQSLQEYDREKESLRTVVRPKHAPKFRQRVRDEEWEAEMDRGRIKRMRSDRYDEDGNEVPYGQRNRRSDSDGGRNKFQESGIKFDSRGRRHA